MSKHTPGPWKAFNASWSETFITASGFDHGICCLDINHATEETQEADESLMEANARLIAAAPELLAALQEITEDYADRFDLESPSTNPGIKYVIKQARSAIAKATGG